MTRPLDASAVARGEHGVRTAGSHEDGVMMAGRPSAEKEEPEGGAHLAEGCEQRCEPRPRPPAILETMWAAHIVSYSSVSDSLSHPGAPLPHSPLSHACAICARMSASCSGPAI